MAHSSSVLQGLPSWLFPRGLSLGSWYFFAWKHWKLQPHGCLCVLHFPACPITVTIGCRLWKTPSLQVVAHKGCRRLTPRWSQRLSEYSVTGHNGPEDKGKEESGQRKFVELEAVLTPSRGRKEEDWTEWVSTEPVWLWECSGKSNVGFQGRDCS